MLLAEALAVPRGTGLGSGEISVCRPWGERDCMKACGFKNGSFGT